MKSNLKSKSSKLKSALKKKELEMNLPLLRMEELFELSHYIGEFAYYWMGIPNSDTVSTLKKNIPLLEKFIDFNIVNERLQIIESFRRNEFGVNVKTFFPEIVELKERCNSQIKTMPQSIRKAECWLIPIALSAGADADVEAATYFYSRSNTELNISDEIKSTWYSYICHDIERGIKVPDEIIKRARSKTISLAEAAEVLKKSNDSLPRFFSFRDEEEDFIDAAMFRAAEWLGITGFDPWLKSLIYHNLSMGPIYGIDPPSASWWLFHWFRSDLALQMADRQGLEAWLWALINGQVDREKPWKVFEPNYKREIREYIPIAAIIPFIWHRIKPTNINQNTLERAVNLLLLTQMQCGGWPLFVDESKPDFLSTCAAIHGLVMHKPNGWEKMVSTAATWLLSQQESLGYWHIDGGPTVMLTVLALDSVELGRGGTNVTFKLKGTAQKNKKVKTINKIAYEPVYIYEGQKWYDPQLPKLKSTLKSKAQKECKPKLAILVATETELRQALRLMKPLPKQTCVWKITHQQETYYIGVFGRFQTVILYSSMGTDCATGSFLASQAIIRNWNPKIIVSLGIAFGVSRDKQLCADVLISENIIPYETQRVGKHNAIFRAPMPPSSPILVNRFRNALDWNFLRPDGTKCKIHIGPILTGAKLVDNLKFKNSLISQFPNAIGGEMEGAGLWSVAQREKREWIIVKGVCDWGDGHKHSEFQQMAAASASSICYHVFSDPHALDGV